MIGLIILVQICRTLRISYEWLKGNAIELDFALFGFIVLDQTRQKYKSKEFTRSYHTICMFEWLLSHRAEVNGVQCSIASCRILTPDKSGVNERPP